MFKKNMKKIGALALAGALTLTSLTGCGSSNNNTGAGASGSAVEGTVKLTNVSYDPTRELYQAMNESFKKYYKGKTGNDIEITQSHGGYGGQARSVVEGAEADVVTLALAHDITLIEEAGLIDSGWLQEFDRESSPYTSTIVFLVRKGNEKGITDWDSLTKEGVEVITPDPKSSGGACWNFLAAWHYAQKKFNNDETQIKDFVKKIYDNVTVMDSGARGATTTFVENGQGDVLIAWENEAIATVTEYPDDYEIVSPSVSILAQPSVAIVDENANKNGTQEAAKEYLNYLYTEEAQKIIGENGYRPSDEKILKNYEDKFDLDMELCEINDFGGWDQAYKDFFQDGAIFDEIHQA
ncbi:MAG: sulfate ABC transporter substrate-binding protein [Eubacterium sp.]|nr:sulfate ABC transporter substrate-binding protein [Eubacterium sp.]